MKVLYQEVTSCFTCPFCFINYTNGQDQEFYSCKQQMSGSQKSILGIEGYIVYVELGGEEERIHTIDTDCPL